MIRSRGSNVGNTGASRATVTLLGVTVACMALLVGCAPADTNTDVATEPIPQSTRQALPLVESTTPPFGGVQGDIPRMSEVANDPDLRNYVTLTTCEPTETGWGATGEASNPEGVDRSYRLVVFFTDAQSRAITSGTIDTTVPGGETTAWAVDVTFTPSEGTRCVLAGVAPAS